MRASTSANPLETRVPESLLIGLAMALRGGDHVCASAISPAHGLAAGASLDDLALRMFGREGNGGQSDRRAALLKDLDLDAQEDGPHVETYAGASPAVILGTAIARRALAPQSVVVAHLDASCLSEGRTVDMLAAAAAMALPLLLVISRPVREDDPALRPGRDPQPQGPFIERARSFGLDAVALRACDFFAVHHAAVATVAKARAGRGPSLIEALVGPADCLTVFREKAIAADLFDADRLAIADAQVARALNAAFPAPRSEVRA